MEAITSEVKPEPSVTQLDSVSRDRIFEILSNSRRRRVIRYLKANADVPEVRIRDLAEQLAAWENETAISDVTYKQRKRVYTSLYQSHLPKMAKYGFIEYDKDRGTVALTPETEALDVYLEIVPGGELSWSDFWLGLSAVAVAFATAAWSGAIPLVSSWQVAFLLAITFLVTSVVHAVYTRRNKLSRL